MPGSWISPLTSRLALVTAAVLSVTAAPASALPPPAETTLTGVVRVVAADPPPGVPVSAAPDPYETVLVVGEETYQLEGRALPPNTRVEVTGEVTEPVEDVAVIDVESVDVIGRAPAGLSPTGTTRSLVVLVTWPGLVPDGVTPASMARTMFTDTDAWFRDASYGALGVTGDVTPWLTVPGPSGNRCYGDRDALMAQAKDQAAARGYDAAAYTHVTVYFPSASALPGQDCSSFAGWATVSGREMWLNGYSSTRETVHELGHNYGLWHSNSYLCPGGMASTSCDFLEYGDPYDAMGSSSTVGHFNASQKTILGWLGSRTRDLSSGGSVTLVPMAQQSSAVHTAKVAAGAGRSYWLEHRQALGADRDLPATGTDGVLVHVRDDAIMGNSGSGLLDVQPVVGQAVTEATLRSGQSWTTPEGQVISVGAVTAAGAEVTVRAAPARPSAPQALRAAPGDASATVTWTPPADGGAPTSTTVTASPGGRSATVDGAATTATVTGLANGTSYTFTAVASNAAGASPASAPSNAVTPVASTSTLVSESFGSSASAFTTSGGTWRVSSGKYVLTAPVSTKAPNSNLAIHSTAVSGDFTLTVQGSTTATSSAFNDFSVVFGYQGPNDYYYASFNEGNDSGTSGIFRVAGGVKTELADIPGKITAGTTHPVRIERQGSAIRVYRSGALAAQATDGTHSGGRVGLGTNNDGATFDDLLVRRGVPQQVIAESFGSSTSAFTTSGGTWRVSSGAYVLTTPVSTRAPNSNLAVHATPVTGDYTVTVKGSTTATSSAFNDFSVVFGYQGPGEYYYASFNEGNDSGTSGIFKVTGGVKAELADIPGKITAGTSYPVRIERQGSAIRVYRSGALAAQTTDGAYAGGRVGVGTNNDGAAFDDLVVVREP